MLRAFLTWFWAQLDGGKVDPYVWGYYITLLSWGVLATFVLAPIDVVQSVMGHRIYDYWAWMNIAGTLCVLTGKVLPGKSRYLGLWMELGGNACMCLVLFAFEYSGMAGTLPLEAGDSLMVFVLLALAPYVLGCGLLTMQSGRKLWQVEQVKRQEAA